MEIKNSGRLIKILPICFIFILTIVFFHPVIFQGKTFYAFDTLLRYLPWSSYAPPDFRANNPLITDPVNIFYPFKYFFKACINSKTLCFWKDYNFCGTIANPPTHPAELFFYLIFPQSIAHDLLLWFHLLGTGLFMFLYLKEIGLKSFPALIGGISWMFNGYVMVWFEFENVILLAPSFVASLYFFERWIKTRTTFHSLCLTGAIGFSISTGYAHLLIYQFIFLFLYFVCRYFLMERGRADFKKIGRQELSGLILAILLVICISSSFLINNLSVLHDGFQRREFSFKDIWLQTGELSEHYLTTLLFPDFFGSPAGENISFTPRIKGAQPYNNYNELCIYSGIVPLLLMLVCLPWLKRRKFALFYFFTAIITLSMAMGSILYYPMARFVPGLNLSTPTRILYIFGFSMSVLAGIGADILTSAEDKKKWIIVLLWSLVAGTAISLSLFVQTEAGIRWAVNPANLSDWTRFHGAFQKHFALLSPIIFEPLCLILISCLSLTSVLFFRKTVQRPSSLS